MDHEEPMYDRTIYPDGASVSGGADWKAWASVIGATVAILISLSSVVRTAVTNDDLDKFQRTFHQPLEKRVESLELSRDLISKEIGALAGTINVMKVQIASVESSQARMESTLRETTGELKQMIRDIGNKLERYQQGRGPAPQSWWDDEWHLYVPQTARITHAIERRP